MTAHLTRIKAQLALVAHRKMRGVLEGQYAALHVGRGIDFNDLREYVRGDDVKDIDWKASARSRQLLVKRYVAERKHTVLLVVSTGRSMAALNEPDVPKRDLAVFVAGVIGYLATRHKDHVALVYGDSERQHVQPPAEGELHLERLLGLVHDATTPDAPAGDLVALLDTAARVIRRRTIMVVVGDERTISDELAEAIRRLAVRHEVLFVTIDDLDPTGPVPASGGLAGARRAFVDVADRTVVPTWLGNDPQLRREYAARVQAQDEERRRRLDQLELVHENIPDQESAVPAVVRLLERHRRGRRR